ncbi:MAG TPA: DUF2214 family protein [Candidatus Acidoferrales bacterium]|nr:DUF2214 family protein [Candidatus Acidoferrales bacterium]
MLDLWLAIAHHLLIFALFGILAAELVSVRRGMSRKTVTLIASIDIWYGILAGLILVVGFARAIFAAKGWFYYSHNLFFWAKITTFFLVALLSLPPTLQFIRWAQTNETPPDGAVQRVRAFLFAELFLFALLPVFAAAMARGYGEHV